MRTLLPHVCAHWRWEAILAARPSVVNHERKLRAHVARLALLIGRRGVGRIPVEAGKGLARRGCGWPHLHVAAHVKHAALAQISERR